MGSEAHDGFVAPDSTTPAAQPFAARPLLHTLIMGNKATTQAANAAADEL